MSKARLAAGLPRFDSRSRVLTVCAREAVSRQTETGDSLCLWPWLFLLTLMYSPPLTGQSAGAAPSDTLARANELHAQASDLEAKGQWREAAVLRKQIARLVESRLGPDHPDTDTVKWNLANTLLASGQPTAALQALEQCLEARTKALGPGAYAADSRDRGATSHRRHLSRRPR